MDIVPPEAKLIEVRRKSFRDQAIWFLNSSEAGDDPAKCELVRRIEQKCSSIDASSEKESVVDELVAHRLLEASNKPCTSTELRKFMQTTCSGKDKRRISLAELLIYQFGYDWKELVNRPECRDVLAERYARDELEQAKVELNKLTAAAKNAARASEEAHQSETKALSQELAASTAIEAAQSAQRSLDERTEIAASALDALKLEEEAARDKKEELERIASDGSKGIVARNKARAELSILLSQDPITLRTARIQQEAAVKKMTAAAKKAENTISQSESALKRATHARKEALRLKELARSASKRAEEAIPSAQAAFDKMSQTLDDILMKEKTGKGSIYFIQADLYQSRKYLPNSRFAIAQKRVSEIVQLADSPSPLSTAL